MVHTMKLIARFFARHVRHGVLGTLGAALALGGGQLRAASPNYALQFDGVNDYVTFGKSAGDRPVDVHARTLVQTRRRRRDDIDRNRWRDGGSACQQRPRAKSMAATRT